jgi:hypothetical protein
MTHDQEYSVADLEMAREICAAFQSISKSKLGTTIIMDGVAVCKSPSDRAMDYLQEKYFSDPKCRFKRDDFSVATLFKKEMVMITTKPTKDTPALPIIQAESNVPCGTALFPKHPKVRAYVELFKENHE